MSPILARFVTAALIGAASLVNLHPCAAAVAVRPSGFAMSQAAHAGVKASSGSRALHAIPGARSETWNP